MLLLFSSNIFGQVTTLPPRDGDPVEVSITVRINKIYNINSVDETYQTDGYLVLTWCDERLRALPSDTFAVAKVYENSRAQQLIDSSIWFPACELINIQGEQDTPNMQITVHPDGKVVYTERFFGTFHAQMNYRRFPFDTQTFVLYMEPFSYDIHQVIFTSPKLFPRRAKNEHIGDDWEVLRPDSRIEEKDYDHLQHIGHEKSTFSRAVFEVKAKRLYDYYLWQVIFPLLIIILASFVIFWIKEFASQISIGFTLMLTVVAFNFYSASILPKLPYNTFIEYIIIVCYIFIFLGIIAVVINHQVHPDENEQGKNKLIRLFKIGFPLSYLIIMSILYFSYIA